MAAHLISYVTLRQGREVHTFGPGDDVPSWARERITNPGAWSSEEREASAPPPEPTAPPAAKPAAEPKASRKSTPKADPAPKTDPA